MALRLVFMGTPDFAVPTLKKLADSGHQVVAVYTREPKPAGRRLELKPSAIADESVKLGFQTFTPKTFKTSEAVSEMHAHKADAAVVVAYGLILPESILDVFPLGCFNLHASLLPRWRGAAPINRAIMAGDKVTGVKIMRMDEGLDTGPVAIGKRVPIGANETAGDLHDKLAQIGADLMLRFISKLGTKREWKFRRQSFRNVTYANKIEKDETRIDWTRPCKEVHNHCRGLSPFPGAWFELSGLGRVKVLQTAIGVGDGLPGQVIENKPVIACGKGALQLIQLQRAGGKVMPAEAFWRDNLVARTNLLH